MSNNEIAIEALRWAQSKKGQEEKAVLFSVYGVSDGLFLTHAVRVVSDVITADRQIEIVREIRLIRRAEAVKSRRMA